MKRRATYQTLEKKKKLWQKILKLSDWKIDIKFVPATELDNDLAEVVECSAPEKVAKIRIANDYFTDERFGIVFNLDGIILHELIHVMLWDKTEHLAEKIKENSKVIELEEFTADSFSRIIYDLYEGKF